MKAYKKRMICNVCSHNILVAVISLSVTANPILRDIDLSFNEGYIFLKHNIPTVNTYAWCLGLTNVNWD